MIAVCIDESGDDKIVMESIVAHLTRLSYGNRGARARIDSNENERCGWAAITDGDRHPSYVYYSITVNVYSNMCQPV